jgi:hypothetical protein
VPNPELFANLNYHLYSPTAADEPAPLTKVLVTVAVDEERMIAVPVAPSSAGPQSNGISFQLNCSSPTTQTAISAQQYVMTLSRTDQLLACSVNNFKPTDPGGTPSINIFGGVIGQIPSDEPPGYACLPYGYSFQIELDIDSGDTNNVLGATFSAFDTNGKTVGKPQTVDLTKNDDINQNPITDAELAPIVEMTLDIVGYSNGAHTMLISGSGHITYVTGEALSTAADAPAGAYGIATVEASNVTYGELPAGPLPSPVTQSFGYAPGCSYVAVQGPGAALDLYSQPIGSVGWAHQQVAGPGSAYGPPVLTFANPTLAALIAVQGPRNNLSLWSHPPDWSLDSISGDNETYLNPSIAQCGDYVFIAVQGPGHSLSVYWQEGGAWQQPQQVAKPGFAFSAPSLIQINDLACIAVQGPDNSLVFYSQSIDDPSWPGTMWNPQTIRGATAVSTPSLAQIGAVPAIAVEGLYSALDFHIQRAGTWTTEHVAPSPFAASSPSLAQVGDSACIAVQIPGHALRFYWQTIGTSHWNPEPVAGDDSTYSAPSLAQIGTSACIAARGSGDSVRYYWQTIGTGRWHPEPPVAIAATQVTASLAAGPPLRALDH